MYREIIFMKTHLEASMSLLRSVRLVNLTQPNIPQYTSNPSSPINPRTANARAGHVLRGQGNMIRAL